MNFELDAIEDDIPEMSPETWKIIRQRIVDAMVQDIIGVQPISSNPELIEVLRKRYADV